MKTVKLTVEEFQALLQAGNRCSNICFNLEQQERTLPADATAMRDARRAWDIAVSNAKKSSMEEASKALRITKGFRFKQK